MGIEVMADELASVVAWVFTVGVALGALVVGPNVLRLWDWLADRGDATWAR